MYGSTSTVLARPQFTAAEELLGAVVLQDVWVLLPELLPYNVTVVVLHPPPAASHRHVLLLPIR